MTERSDADLRGQLETDGYVVVPGLFSPQMVATLRAILDGFFGSGRGVVFNLGQAQPNAAIECPELSLLLADERVREIFARLIGGPTMFTGQCDIHNGIISVFHRDTGANHGYFEEDCFVEDCRVFKMGVYLQDHLDGKGLTVHPGSHRESAGPTRPPVTLRTKAGDAVIFDVRIVHRGQSPNLIERVLHKINRTLEKLGGRFFGRSPQAGQPRFGYALRERARSLLNRNRRLAIFFTYGPDNRFTDQFARACMVRQLGQYAGGRIAYPEDLVVKLRQGGVKIYYPELENAD